MKLRILTAALLALTVIGCKDSIDVPNDNVNDDPKGDGVIVYNSFDIDSDGDQYGAVATIDGDGTRIREIGLGLSWGGGVSAGKNAIVMAEPGSQQGEVNIVVTDNNGGNRRTIATLLGPDEEISSTPVISRNGEFVAYISSISLGQQVRGYRLHVLKADGSSPNRIISERVVRETVPGLSPDGRQIAFFETNRFDNTKEEVVVAHTDGTGSNVIVQLSEDVGGDLSSTISWGAKRIAYSVVKGDEFRMFIVNPDGSQLIPIDDGVVPSWSDDGDFLTWTALSNDKINAEIVYSGDLGSTVTTLTTTSNPETHPQFSPDGKKIMYTSWVDDPMESRGKLIVIDLESKETKTVAEPGYGGSWLRW